MAFWNDALSAALGPPALRSGDSLDSGTVQTSFEWLSFFAGGGGGGVRGTRFDCLFGGGGAPVCFVCVLFCFVLFLFVVFVWGVCFYFPFFFLFFSDG